MAQLCGKWELISSDDNFEQYMKAVGVSEEKIQLAKTALCAGSKLCQEISRDGAKWSITIITPAGAKTDVYTEGQPSDVTTLDGRNVKVVYSLEQDQLVETQTGPAYESRNVRKVDGDTMRMTFTTKDVSCTRVYKRI